MHRGSELHYIVTYDPCVTDTVMDKYATLGTLYELKRVRRKKRGESTLPRSLPESGRRVMSTASSPDLPSLLGVRTGGAKNRAHSISACVSQATKCALVVCSEEGAVESSTEELWEVGTKSEVREKWSESVKQEQMNKKHSRDSCDCEEPSDYLKTPITIKITEPPEDAPITLQIEPEPPDLSWLKGSFNPDYLPRKPDVVVRSAVSVSENRLLDRLRRIRSSTPDTGASPWFSVCSVRRRPRPATLAWMSRSGPHRPASPMPASVLYCTSTHLKSFNHIMDKVIKRDPHYSSNSVS